VIFLLVITQMKDSGCDNTPGEDVVKLQLLKQFTSKKVIRVREIVLLQVLNQDETPLRSRFFHGVQSSDLSLINSSIAVEFLGNFLYLFISSTILGVLVTLSLSI